jgi:hypothetical protein
MVLPWCLRLCGARIWVVKHLANDWLAGTDTGLIEWLFSTYYCNLQKLDTMLRYLLTEGLLCFLAHHTVSANVNSTANPYVRQDLFSTVHELN